MNKNLAGWGIVVLIILGGGFWLWQRNSSVSGTILQSMKPEKIPSVTSVEAPPPPAEDEAVGAIEERQAVSDGANQITITSGNLFYRPDRLTLKQGEPVTLTFANTGFHTFTVDELGLDELIEGSLATVEFTPTQAGTFEFYCTVPGHREGGMVGTLTVQ